ncbi:MAG: hypothetical protein R6X20_18255 [Phycisphaerae bacterium]
MADYVKRARQVVKDVMKEFEPASGHAVSAGREMLLALRSAVDAEINLYDRATRKREGGEPCEGETGAAAEARRVEVEPEPLAQPGGPGEAE